MSLERLQTLYNDIEVWEKKVTFICQLPKELQRAVYDLLTFSQQILECKIDVDDCMNEKVDFVTDWIDCVIDNM